MVNGLLPPAASAAEAAPPRAWPKSAVCEPPLRPAALKSNPGAIRIVQILDKNAAHST
jgi:hypothetical protein